LGRLVEGDKDHGFKVVIVAQKKSGDVARSGDHVFLHPDKASGDLKVGTLIEMNKLSNKALPAHSYGRLLFIQENPAIVK
jgi:hypothetical protein